MFKSHHQDTDENDDGHEEVQEVAGTQSMDGPTDGGVVHVVRYLLRLWNTHVNTHTQTHTQSRYSDVRRQATTKVDYHQAPPFSLPKHWSGNTFLASSSNTSSLCFCSCWHWWKVSTITPINMSRRKKLIIMKEMKKRSIHSLWFLTGWEERREETSDYIFFFIINEK